MTNLLHDFRYALRSLRKRPGFTALAVLTLALGVGATTAIFSVVNAVLLRPLPYREPQRLVRIYSEFPGFPNGGLRRFPVSAPEYLDLRREATRSWESVDAWQSSGVNLSGGGGDPARVSASFVTGGLLPSLGVAPQLGRLLSPADDLPSAPLVAAVSHGLWKSAFGGDRGVVGREVLLNGQKCTIVGVMPAGFAFPPGEADASDLWVPLQIDPANPGERSNHGLHLLGRLRPGASPAQGRTELDALVNAWGGMNSREVHTFEPKDHPIVTYGLQDEVVRTVRPALRMLLGAVCFVLLIACVNVANLLLVRAEARQRETAVRGAVGASLPRLAAQFVAEGLVLSALGGLAGLALAYYGLSVVTAAGDANLPRAAEVGIDARVFAFAAALCCATGVAFGLTPLAHAGRQKLYDALKSSSSATTAAVVTQRFRQALVVAELALAVVLLAGTGLMVRAFWKVQEVDVGLNPRGVLTGFVALPQATYGEPGTVRGFWRRLEQRLAALPGVKAAALVTGLPPSYPSVNNRTEIEGYVPPPGAPLPHVEHYQVVSHGYFEAMGVRLAAGRLFEPQDGPTSALVVVVNQSMARAFWGNQSPLGRRVRVGDGDAAEWCAVVGVVADVKTAGVDRPTGTELYFPFDQPPAADAAPSLGVYAVVRCEGDPSGMAAAVRRQVQELDPSLPLARVRTMEDVMAAAQSRPRFLALLLTLFAGAALLLAAVGLYGVMSYAVAQRTREFGVRLALGARPRQLMASVLARAAVLTAAGLVAGLAGAAAVTRLLSGMLFGVKPSDPATFVTVSVLLAAVALLASYLAARRATRVEPLAALRYD